MTDHEAWPFSDVRCTLCGGSRIKRKDGTPGACSFLPCPNPLYDVDVERGRCPVIHPQRGTQCLFPAGHSPGCITESRLPGEEKDQ